MIRIAFFLSATSDNELPVVQSKATTPVRMSDFVDSLGVEKLTALGRINSARVELDKFSFCRSGVTEEPPHLTGYDVKTFFDHVIKAV